MKIKKKYVIILSAISIFFLVSLVILNLKTYRSINTSTINSELNDKLIIHYIDVGQGDCELIHINDKYLLIDSGSKEYKNKVYKYLKHLGIKKIDYIIATHPHEDHIGGMSKIINSFSIDNFIAPKVVSSSSYFNAMIKSLKNKNLRIQTAEPGISFYLSPAVKCEIVAPNSKKYAANDLNDYSVVLKVTYNNTKFLFTGDAEKISETEILARKYRINSDVLKIGHHGSNSSSSSKFLNAVSPKIAIISCGKNNQYNHPHCETINNLNKLNCKIFRTDMNGTIILISDGNNIYKVNTEIHK